MVLTELENPRCPREQLTLGSHYDASPALRSVDPQEQRFAEGTNGTPEEDEAEEVGKLEWQQREIASLKHEVRILKQRKGGLEQQIHHSEEANATIQNSFGAWSRVSTATACNNSTLLVSSTMQDDFDSSWLDERQKLLDEVTDLEALHRRLEMTMLEAVGKMQDGGMEVLDSSVAGLAEERKHLTEKLISCEAEVAELEAASDLATTRLVEAEHQASEWAVPFADFQVLCAAINSRMEINEELEHAVERADRAFQAIQNDKGFLREAGQHLRSEITTLLEAFPRVAHYRDEASAQALAAEKALIAARSRWTSEVQHWHTCLSALESQLQQLHSRQESAFFANVSHGEELVSLEGSLQNARTEHSTLLRLQRSDWQPSSGTSATPPEKTLLLQEQCKRSELEVSKLRADLCDVEAQRSDLLSRRALWHDATATPSSSSTAVVHKTVPSEPKDTRSEKAPAQTILDSCEERLHLLAQQMHSRAEMLETQLLGEHRKAEDLRRELAAAWEAGASEKWILEPDQSHRSIMKAAGVGKSQLTSSHMSIAKGDGSSIHPHTSHTKRSVPQSFAPALRALSVPSVSVRVLRPSDVGRVSRDASIAVAGRAKRNQQRKASTRLT